MLMIKMMLSLSLILSSNVVVVSDVVTFLIMSNKTLTFRLVQH